MDKLRLRFCLIEILLMSVIPATLGLHVSIAQSTYEVARGDEVIITCKFQPKSPVNRLIIISWTGDPDGSFDDEGISFGTFYSDDSHVDINAMYEGKAHIEVDMREKMSKLLLKHVTLRESRRIRCLVQIPGDTEGQKTDTTSLVVLVAPSDPVCKIKGTPEYGQNISVTCVSEEGSPVPNYQWQSYDVKNKPRSLPPKATDKDGVLSLFNVSMETSGYYICTSSNKIRSATCNITLAVMPSTMKIGATAGIIGGCVAGIAGLVLIIYCCCRDKQQPEEFDMEPPGIEYHDIPKEEKEEDGPRDVRKTSIEGCIDQRERYEMKADEDIDRNSNRRFDYDDHQEDSQRYDDRRDNYSNGHDEDRRERHDDRKHHDRRSHHDDLADQYDDRQNRYDGRRDRFNDQQDRYGDHRDHYDNRQNRFGDRRDHYNNRQEHYSDHRDRYGDLHERNDDGRGHHRQNRYDDDRNNFDDRREDYDDQQGRYDNHRYRYDHRQDRQDHYSDNRDRYGRQDQYSDRNDH